MMEAWASIGFLAGKSTELVDQCRKTVLMGFNCHST